MRATATRHMGRSRQLAGWWCLPLVWHCLACSTATAAPPLSPRADGGSSSSAEDGSEDGDPEASTRNPLPPPPDPVKWADVERPAPSSISLAQPGGDAEDGHAAALVRLLEEPFGMLRDKDDQVRIELPDRKHWKRVRYRTFDHLVGFRYGSKYHAVSVILAIDTRSGRPADSLACIRQAETIARPRVRALNVQFGAINETEIEWRGKRVVVHSVEGAFPWAFKTYDFSAAWASYPAYEHGCLIYGIGIKHEGRPELARLLRDRWILEAATKVETRTEQKPVRKP